MTDAPLKDTAALITRDFEMEGMDTEQVSPEALFDALADQIAYLLEHRLEFLLSLMYRLDVSEAKVRAALAANAPEPANIGLTRIVLERQAQRAFTKQKYKPQPTVPDDDDDWRL